MQPKRVLVLPGYANSGPGHWQTRWEALDRAYSRVAMPDWDHPVCEAWCDALERAIAAEQERGSAPVLLAAHSLGCLTAAAWAARRASPATLAAVAGALLVAVPDPKGPEFPADARGYEPVSEVPLPFPTVVVASSDDPYGSLAFAERCANAWGSRLVELGPRGHINADSRLGDWEEGRRWLAALAAE